MKHIPLLAIGAALMLAAGACSDDPPPPNDEDSSASSGGEGGMPMTGPVTSTGGGGFMELPATFTVEGSVADPDGEPVAGAIVLQGGRSDEPTQMTGPDGTFSLELSYPGYGTPGVIAAKEGFRAAGVEFLTLPEVPVLITLYPYEPIDNPDYDYMEPGVGGDPSTAYCGHCHETFASDFQQSLHKDAASDPEVHDLYAGVASAIVDEASCTAAGGAWQQGLEPGTASTAIDKCYLGGGVLGDLNTTCGGPAQLACDDPTLPAGDAPTSYGACADCHAPGLPGVPGGRNLHDAVGIAFENGVFCDVCHKVRDVDLSKPPGVGSDLRLILQRPQELLPNATGDHRQLMFGPLLDVPNAFMGGVQQSKFDDPQFCAGCHQQQQPALVPGDSVDAVRWPNGLDVHTTYQEWLDGPYAQSGTTCQHCHMPPHFELANSVDVSTKENQSITFGYPRSPDDNREHIFRGPLYEDGFEPRLIDTALFSSVALELNGSSLTATVSVANVGCGHAVPTGEPMRSLVMLVTAEGAGCGTVPATGGMTVFDVGGSHASGVEGTDVTTAGSVLTWPAGAAAAQSGMVVRVVRPTGSHDDYEGIGFFADGSLTPADKGLPIIAPVDEATVVGAGAGQVTLDAALTVQAGDVIHLGDAISAPADGAPARAFAGAAGYAFARVLTDSAGNRHVPHYRAVDMASDNRIPPGDKQLTTHTFDVSGCTDATVSAIVLYRPHPLAQARLRGWDARDYVVATAEATIDVP